MQYLPGCKVIFIVIFAGETDKLKAPKSTADGSGKSAMKESVFRPPLT